MTSTIIDRVHLIAISQNAPIGLTFGDSQDKVTILDLDTKNNNNDDNASDVAFEQDDDTIESELTGVVSEPSENRNIYHNEEDDGYKPDAEGIHEDNNADNADNHNKDAPQPTIEDNDDHSQQELHTNDYGDDKEAIDFEHNNEDETIEITHPEIEGEEQPSRRSGLRQTVTQTHNKFGSNEGYKSTTHHRSFFTAEFGDTIAKLEREHIGFV